MASGANTVSDVNLEQVLEEVAKEKGIEKQALIDTIEAAILKAAQNTFGSNRELEAHYKPESGHVELYQYMTVVEEVEDPEREVSMADVTRFDLGAELGEELGFQIFWREADKEKARRSAAAQAIPG